MNIHEINNGLHLSFKDRAHLLSECLKVERVLKLAVKSTLLSDNNSFNNQTIYCFDENNFLKKSKENDDYRKNIKKIIDSILEIKKTGASLTDNEKTQISKFVFDQHFYKTIVMFLAIRPALSSTYFFDKRGNKIKRKDLIKSAKTIYKIRNSLAHVCANTYHINEQRLDERNFSSVYVFIKFVLQHTNMINKNFNHNAKLN